MASDLLDIFDPNPRYPWQWHVLAMAGAERARGITQNAIIPRRVAAVGFYRDGAFGPVELPVRLAMVSYEPPEPPRPRTRPPLRGLAEGTRVTTARGDVAVELLHPGDLILSPSVVLRKLRDLTPIRIDSRTTAHPASVWPVRIAAGAIASRAPRRDLLVSPDLGIWIDGIVVPARALVNGTTIVQEPAGEIIYFQLVHAAPGLALAEGVPFVSGPRPGDPPPPVSHGRAPPDIVLRGPTGAELYAIRYKLAARAIELGRGPVAEQTLLITATGPQEARIAAGTVAVRLVSNTTTPPNDGRRLGAAIGDIRLDGIPVDVDDPRLQGGLYQVEGAPERPFRWTNGEAMFFVGQADQSRMLTLEVFATAGSAAPAT